jgi:MFS family permease
MSGAFVSGLGQGLAFMGGLAAIKSLAPRDKRGETLSAYFIVSCVFTSAPVMGLGFAADSLGLYHAALWFAVFIGALALVTEAVAFMGATRERLHVRLLKDRVRRYLDPDPFAGQSYGFAAAFGAGESSSIDRYRLYRSRP